jgi:hypothetical protein
MMTPRGLYSKANAPAGTSVTQLLSTMTPKGLYSKAPAGTSVTQLLSTMTPKGLYLATNVPEEIFEPE